MVALFSRRKGPVIIIFAAAKIQVRLGPILIILSYYGTDSSSTWSKYMHLYRLRTSDIALANLQQLMMRISCINILCRQSQSITDPQKQAFIASRPFEGENNH